MTSEQMEMILMVFKIRILRKNVLWDVEDDQLKGKTYWSGQCSTDQCDQGRQWLTTTKATDVGADIEWLHQCQNAACCECCTVGELAHGTLCNALSTEYSSMIFREQLRQHCNVPTGHAALSSPDKMGPTEPVSTAISHIPLFSATVGATGASLQLPLVHDIGNRLTHSGPVM